MEADHPPRLVWARPAPGGDCLEHGGLVSQRPAGAAHSLGRDPRSREAWQIQNPSLALDRFECDPRANDQVVCLALADGSHPARSPRTLGDGEPTPVVGPGHLADDPHLVGSLLAGDADGPSARPTPEVADPTSRLVP